MLVGGINFQSFSLLRMGRAECDGQKKPSDKEIHVLAVGILSGMQCKWYCYKDMDVAPRTSVMFTVFNQDLLFYRMFSS